MNNPDHYILLQDIQDLSGYEGVDPFSNLDWGKDQARRLVGATRSPCTIYKLVPVFEASIEITTRVIEKNLLPPPDDRRDWDAADEAERGG